jgi:hypothetical protein
MFRATTLLMSFTSRLLSNALKLPGWDSIAMTRPWSLTSPATTQAYFPMCASRSTNTSPLLKERYMQAYCSKVEATMGTLKKSTSLNLVP